MDVDYVTLQFQQIEIYQQLITILNNYDLKISYRPKPQR